MSEVTVFVEPEAESGVTEAGAAVEPKAEAETDFSDSFTEAEPESEDIPPAAILIPPLSLIFVVISALLFLMVGAKISQYKLRKERQREEKNLNVGNNLFVDNIRRLGFLSASDYDAMDGLRRHYNQPLALVLIALPAIMSLAFCPLILFIRSPLIAMFWGDSNSMPNINDAIACFLAPAGLVYAVSFGFTFQSVLEKQKVILDAVSLEIGFLDQILSLTAQLPNATLQEKKKVCLCVKDETISIMEQIQGKRGLSISDYKSNTSSGQIWKVMGILRSNVQDKHLSVDNLIMDHIISNIMELNKWGSERQQALAFKVHPLQWSFLEVVGFFSFFGVMLIETQSPEMNLTMCILTVFSITLLCYVVADLDSPLNGYFRVDLSLLWDLVDKTKDIYESANNGIDILHTTYSYTTANKPTKKDLAILAFTNKPLHPCYVPTTGTC
ncbi:uncharacterized protein LOC117119461 [Anneissia japonica]|uniref:uncharacterized protein LOC117119461 n=1 Tax=Anneissia japonica TaxID=1529436 RepID=UPI001425909D|nr:uncharacterized protein LOC117119461 [Anneissia japonica]